MMTEALEARETVAAELRDLSADEDEGKVELGVFSSPENAVIDDIPPSLISYFTTSQRRAVVCEKLILEDFEDFPTLYEDVINLPMEFSGDVMKLEEQTTIEMETDVLFPHNVAASSHEEDEGERNTHIESANQLEFKVGIPQTQVSGEDMKESSKHTEKHHFGVMAREDQVVQREKDFQEELKKIIEAEKLHQKELQLIEKKAQERIEHELLLQKELISNLQKRVEEERRMREEELKRIEEEKKKEERRRRDDEERRKRQDEKTKREMQINEEEMRKKKKEAEVRRIEEARRKAEEERRKGEEVKDKKEKCEGRGETDKKCSEEQKSKAKEGMRREGEERKADESEEEKKSKEMKEEEIQVKEKNKKEVPEETLKWKEEKGTSDAPGEKIIQEKEKNKKEVPEETLKWKEEKETREEPGEKIIKELCKKEEGETRNEGDRRREEEKGLTSEHEVRIHQLREEHTKSGEENRTVVTDLMVGEEENRQTEDEIQLNVNTERIQADVEGRPLMENKNRTDKIEEEEFRKTQEEETGQKGEEYATMDEQEKENKKEEADNRKVASQYDGREREEEGAHERQVKTEDKENKGATVQTDERRVKDEESKTITELQQEKQEKDDSRNTNNSSSSGPTHHTSTGNHTCCDTKQQHDPDNDVRKTLDLPCAAAQPRSSSGSLLVCLPECTEQKRLSWMKDCVPWSRLSLQNRRKPKGSAQSGRLPRKPIDSSSLPPLCSDALLQSTGLKSLCEVTTVTLEDLPGCNLSTLLQCTRLWSLTLRRCGLKSLEGVSHLPELCYIDVEENDISFVDCENMTSLRVLRLGHNKLTSIHGLSGADNLDVLELSHNSISRIAGLESMRRLQRLSVDHNQLISTKGLRDIYTLIHLNCSHNHLAVVEGLENSSLLNTLDLRANSLTEPPNLTNHVLLRELRLDDNSISSLQSLAACWLPLLQHLSVPQNRITHLPSMSDFISLKHLDLRFNCMSEVQNVCESLEGCHFLQDLHLTGNPLQQESGWRSSLQKALLGLRAIDDQETDYFFPPPAVLQNLLAFASFQSFCQFQIQQIHDLQQQYSRQLSEASSPLDAIKGSLQHFTETLKLAEDQRFAHECGDVKITAGQTALEKTIDVDRTNAETFDERLPSESTAEAPPVIESRNNISDSCFIFEEKSSTESWNPMLDTVTNLQSSAPFSSNFKTSALCNQDLALKTTAAGVIQQQWRKYRLKHGRTGSLPQIEKHRGGGDGGNTQSRTFYNKGKSVDPQCAATVIQAFWRGRAVRRRLLSALDAVARPSSGEDDTFEEIDVDEFVFDEAELEKLWTSQLFYDSLSRRDPMSDELPPLKFSGLFPDHIQYTLPPPPLWKPRQAWKAGEPIKPAGMGVSPESPSRKSPASTCVLSGVSERSGKILEEWGFTDSHTAHLMLKRAQRMKSKQQQKHKWRDPFVRLALLRNCHYQLGPVEAQYRPAANHRNFLKVSKNTLGLKQCERKEQVEQEQDQQWPLTQSDRNSDSEHFLPEISPDILKGGRVQLVADPAYTERRHPHSTSAAHARKPNGYARRVSSGHTRKDVPSPKAVASAPSKKECISFRDNPVHLSHGWGGGKKRDKINK